MLFLRNTEGQKLAVGAFRIVPQGADGRDDVTSPSAFALCAVDSKGLKILALYESSEGMQSAIETMYPKALGTIPLQLDDVEDEYDRKLSYVIAYLLSLLDKGYRIASGPSDHPLLRAD